MNTHRVLAGAVVSEEVHVVFGLMGDANMDLLADLHGSEARVVQGRHENAVVAMADGYSRATGKVGVCSVTCGPGVTQIGTSLTASVRHRTPLVVLAGDTPIGDAFHLQEFDIGPFVRSTGAAYRRILSPRSAAESVHAAFHQARSERRPVVLGLPADVQQAPSPEDTVSAAPVPVPSLAPIPPDGGQLDALAELLARSDRPVLLAGAGCVHARAEEALVELANRSGALLATTLRARDMFRRHDYNAGIAGGFATERARNAFAEADLVVAFGATLGHYTTDGGTLFPKATIVQVDIAPSSYAEGIRTGDKHVRGDARLTAEELSRRFADTGSTRGFHRTVRRGFLPGPPVDAEPEIDIEPGQIDPRSLMRELGRCIPHDVNLVIGVGHFWHFAVMYLHGPKPERWHFTYDFGAVGQGLATAIGIALADQERPVVLIEGDGSLLMNLQELETAAREDVSMLVLAMNDGAYGAEVHKLRARGADASLADFGRPNLAAVAQAFGHQGVTIRDSTELRRLVESQRSTGGMTLVDVPVSTEVVSPPYRRAYSDRP